MHVWICFKTLQSQSEHLGSYSSLSSRKLRKIGVVLREVNLTVTQGLNLFHSLKYNKLQMDFFFFFFEKRKKNNDSSVWKQLSMKKETCIHVILIFWGLQTQTIHVPENALIHKPILWAVWNGRNVPEAKLYCNTYNLQIGGLYIFFHVSKTVFLYLTFHSCWREECIVMNRQLCVQYGYSLRGRIFVSSA